MKIEQLLNGYNSLVSNEEHQFIKKYPDNVSLRSLSEHDHWIAQNLVRKGVYEISNDDNTITKKLI
jgi:hypothetical protein